uniref:DUF1799 domain-containing protein n=1 Tax=Azospirillum argentinense TaxID=2970906 RepID=UPI0020005A27|nr:DUF1799 domain-containing protein [Azospirillum argentinense]
MAADLAAFGAPRELVDRWAGRATDQEDDPEAGHFRVRPDCWKAVSLFARLETQWQWVGSGMAGAERTGLRYEAIGVTAGMAGITMTTALFDDLQVMEAAALGELAKIMKERIDRLDRERPRGRGR